MAGRARGWPVGCAAIALAAALSGVAAWAQDSGVPAPQPLAESPLSPPASEFDRPLTPAPALRLPAAWNEPVPGPSDRMLESSWYTRVDYFHWNERIDGADFMNEEGVLTTLGYVRRNGPERFRAEFFGGNVSYYGAAQFDDGSFEYYTASTNYLGCRGEYDLLFQPVVWPNTLFFLGVGTRFCIRDLPDAQTPSGAGVRGYQETWWTIYPYFGMEVKRPLSWGPEAYAMGRLGATAITYEHVGFNDAALYPKPDLTGQVELGVRGRSVSVAAFFESMNWRASPVVRDSFQPDSRMLTVGGRLAYRF